MWRHSNPTENEEHVTYLVVLRREDLLLVGYSHDSQHQIDQVEGTEEDDEQEVDDVVRSTGTQNLQIERGVRGVLGDKRVYILVY